MLADTMDQCCKSTYASCQDYAPDIKDSNDKSSDNEAKGRIVITMRIVTACNLWSPHALIALRLPHGPVSPKHENHGSGGGAANRRPKTKEAVRSQG